MQISEDGLLLIERFEGFVGHPYQDSVGVWTIGFGHTHGVTAGSPDITVEEGTALLKADVELEYGAAVNSVGVPLTQHEFDATTSFVYNLGTGVLSDGGFGRLLRAQQYDAAANAMLGYDHAGGEILEGLAVRRAAERKLFLTPDPTPIPPPTPVDYLLPAERNAYDKLTVLREHPWKNRHQIEMWTEAIARMRSAIYVAAEDGKAVINGKLQDVPKGWDKRRRLTRYRTLYHLVPPK